MKSSGNPAMALVTLVPLVWLLAVTMTAGVQKILHPDPRIGFLAQAKVLNAELPALDQAVAAAKAAGETEAIERAEQALLKNRSLHFNNCLDAVVAASFLVLVTAILLLSVREWVLLLTRRKPAVLHETEPVWLPEYAVAESRPFHLAGLAALVFALTKELSGEAEMERLSQIPTEGGRASPRALVSREQGVWARGDARPPECAAHAGRRDAGVYLEVTERRFKGVKHCC